jgi:hypothetical protein
MSLLPPDYVERMAAAGALAKAQARALAGVAHLANKAHWDKFSTWSLICEEILDTELADDWYDDVLAELGRRGFDFEQINRMRRFAWKTAGWLNYEKMLWDWVSLSERDIKLALNWQLEDGIITPFEHAEGLRFIEQPGSIPPGS